MSNRMRIHAKNFAEQLQTGTYSNAKQITKKLNCTSGLSAAFNALGLIWRHKGKIYANWHGDCPIESVVDEYYRARKGFDKKVKPALIAPTLRQDSDEKTYTKQQVIDAFKAFYVREYDRLDDRAYTLVGFLLTAL